MHRTPSLAPLAAAALALALGTASAQTGAARSFESSPHAAIEAGQEQPSDADLKTFAEIYTELQEADTRFEHDIATARSPQEARAVADARHRASTAALTSHGWTRSKFDRVASAIDHNPALIERAIALFEEDS
jgi:hypothetical protein